MIVDSLMHRPVVVADAGTSAREAARAMERDRVGCLIVTREGRAVGIVTERDLVFRVLGAARDPDATHLGDIMSAPIATVTQDASSESAAATMKRRGIKRRLVVRAGEPRGLISVPDIA